MDDSNLHEVFPSPEIISLGLPSAETVSGYFDNPPALPASIAVKGGIDNANVPQAAAQLHVTSTDSSSNATDEPSETPSQAMSPNVRHPPTVEGTPPVCKRSRPPPISSQQPPKPSADKDVTKPVELTFFERKRPYGQACIPPPGYVEPHLISPRRLSLPLPPAYRSRTATPGPSAPPLPVSPVPATPTPEQEDMTMPLHRPLPPTASAAATATWKSVRKALTVRGSSLTPIDIMQQLDTLLLAAAWAIRTNRGPAVVRAFSRIWPRTRGGPGRTGPSLNAAAFTPGGTGAPTWSVHTLQDKLRLISAVLAPNSGPKELEELTKKYPLPEIPFALPLKLRGCMYRLRGTMEGIDSVTDASDAAAYATGSVEVALRTSLLDGLGASRSRRDKIVHGLSAKVSRLREKVHTSLLYRFMLDAHGLPFTD